MEAWRAELYHHGIKGMKWGVRRTPAELGHKLKARSKAIKDARARLPSEWEALEKARLNYKKIGDRYNWRGGKVTEASAFVNSLERQYYETLVLSNKQTMGDIAKSTAGVLSSMVAAGVTLGVLAAAANRK